MIHSATISIRARLPICRAAISLLLFIVWASFAHAHRANESYVYFDVTEDTLSGRVEITLKDLTRIQQKSSTVNDLLTKTQLIDQQEDFTDYFQERLKLSKNGKPYEIEFKNISFFRTKGRTYAQFHFDVLGVDMTPVTIDLAYRGMFEDVDPQHRGFALIGSNTRNNMDENEAYISLIFSFGDGAKKLYLNDESNKDIARTFFERGVWQMLLGWGHVLFLVPLLLGALVRLENSRWVPVESASEAVRETAKIVAAFTIAHSFALWLATLAGINLSRTLVDAAIAVSIVVVALWNLSARFSVGSWKLVALFGLFHGLGFANALDQFGLDPARVTLGLGSFNIGIEIGQLILVLLLFPIFFTMRNMSVYRVVGLKLGSTLAIIFTLAWFIGRTVGSIPLLSDASAGVLY